MKTTLIRSTAIAAGLMALSAGAANAGNVSFGLGFHSPAPVYYEPYYAPYPQPVYYAPSYRFTYYEPRGYWHRPHPNHRHHRDERGGRERDHDGHRGGRGHH